MTTALQKELQDALLDRDFLLKFAERLRSVLDEPETETVESGEVEIVLGANPRDVNSFLVSGQGLCTDKPTVLVTPQGATEPQVLENELGKKAVAALRKEGAGDGEDFWAGLFKRGENHE